MGDEGVKGFTKDEISHLLPAILAIKIGDQSLLSPKIKPESCIERSIERLKF
jgi:hypothetical protein